MKTFRASFVIVLAALFFSLCFVGDSHAAGKIAFLDLSKIFDSYGKTKEYDEVLAARQQAYEQKRNEKIEKLKEAQGRLALLKEQEREKLEKEMETMKTDLLTFDQTERTQLTKERDEKIREILLEIEKIVSDFGKKEGYDLILNDRVLIYGNETMDVTEQVLKSLNENYNKK